MVFRYEERTPPPIGRPGTAHRRPRDAHRLPATRTAVPATRTAVPRGAVSWPGNQLLLVLW